MGFDLSVDPRIHVCSPIGVPPGRKNMHTTVDLRGEGSTWVGRSTAGAGDLVIRLDSPGAMTASSVAVQGSVTATALWSDPRFPTADLRVKFEGTSVASGDVARSASFINGQITGTTGTIVFSNSTGASSTCPMVLWTMQPIP